MPIAEDSEALWPAVRLSFDSCGRKSLIANGKARGGDAVALHYTLLLLIRFLRSGAGSAAGRRRGRTARGWRRGAGPNPPATSRPCRSVRPSLRRVFGLFGSKAAKCLARKLLSLVNRL